MYSPLACMFFFYENIARAMVLIIAAEICSLNGLLSRLAQKTPFFVAHLKASPPLLLPLILTLTRRRKPRALGDKTGLNNSGVEEYPTKKDERKQNNTTQRTTDRGSYLRIKLTHGTKSERGSVASLGFIFTNPPEDKQKKKN